MFQEWKEQLDDHGGIERGRDRYHTGDATNAYVSRQSPDNAATCLLLTAMLPGPQCHEMTSLKVPKRLHYIYHCCRYRLRSACACLHVASPLKADRLNGARPCHPLRDEDASGASLTSVAAMSSLLSRSAASRGMGIAAVGDSLVVSAACACTSSCSRYSDRLHCAGAFDGLFSALPMERTTSPLHIGHVRRRVVSHGVLESPR